MTYERSVLKHERGQFHQAMEYAGTIRSMLWSHRNCVAGNGDTAESCSRRTYLLEIRHQNG
ncbi:hypothetical protein H0264_01970 [Nocardia huaxiensis]|uniref:Uncharacterized protein n=2 Tax=Nocardia huaxiensis TaxID=2755382 RepID=A0A7D6VCM0_9NOCA|nr:hypothetical protein [Nocardia huaxiensis]QLY31182.1 hypothetical protein H0264_01970 [Nocardia huaxiensis]